MATERTLATIATKPSDEITTSYDTGAIRANKDKVRYDLVPVIALRDITAVFTWGSKKYSDHNWARGFPWSNPYSSMQRHLQAWWAGEDYDEESGYSHLAHAGCNLFMLIWFSYHHKVGDNRMKNPMPQIRRNNG